MKIHFLRNLEVFHKDGGYVVNSVHNIMDDISSQNIMDMFESVQEF